DEEIAISVDIAGVAGEVPTLAQRTRIGVGPLPVALEGLIAGKQGHDLAFLADGSRLADRGGIELDHLHLLIDAGLAGRARLGRRILVNRESVNFRAAIMIDEEFGPERFREL